MHSVSTSSPVRLHDGKAGQLPGMIGVEHEEWRAELHHRGETVIISVTASNPKRALEQLMASDAPMDCWFKDGVRTLTGEDLLTLFA